MSFTKVTVVGLWQQADGSPCTGTVTFRPSAAMQQAADLIVAAASITATLDSTGHISVELDAVDDPTTLPTGVVYDVIERIHRARREYAIVIPHTATTIDLSSVAPAIPGPIVFGYALQSALNAEVTARAAGDADTLSAAETFATGAVGTETARAMTAEAAKAASTYVDAQDAATLAAADSHADSGDAAHAASSTAHPASHVTVAAGAGVTSTDVQAALGEITGMIQSQEAGDSAAVAAVAAGLSDETTRASAAEAANAMAIAAETTRAAAAEATKQAHDADLDTIAALDSTTAGALVTDGAGWIRKTYAQLKTALGLVKGDVGLGNVDNTSDASKPVSTAQAAADAATLSSAQTFATGAVGTETSRAMAAEATKLVAGSTATYANLAALPPASAHTNEIVKTLDAGVYESTGSAWVQLVAPNGTYAPSQTSQFYALGPVETLVDVTHAHAAASATPQVIPSPEAPDLAMVEPCVLHFPHGKWGWKYWLFCSPYKNSDATFENPSMWVSNDGNSWQVLPGFTNPLFPTGNNGGGVQSDQSAVVGPDGKIYMFWNQEAAPAVAGGFWVNMASFDGQAWSTATAVITTVRATTRPASPTVLYDPYLALYVMYCVDAVPNPYVIRRYTATTPAGPWTQSADPIVPTWPVSSRSPFHLNVIYYAGQHILLVNDADNGTSTTHDLYLLTSKDGGVTFDTISSAIMPLVTPLYRSTIVPVETGGRGGLGFDLWYGKIDSGGGTGFRVWRTKIYLTPIFESARPNASGGLAIGVPGVELQAPTTQGLAAGTAYFEPFEVRDTTINLISVHFEVTTAPASNANLLIAIYAADRNLQPTGAPLFSQATAVASGFTGVKTFTNTTQLPIGRYLIRLIADTAMTLRSMPGGSRMSQLNTSMGATPFNAILSNPGIGYADPAPATASYSSLTVASTPQRHGVMLKWSIA